jgi:leucyl aminopeptidase
MKLGHTATWSLLSLALCGGVASAATPKTVWLTVDQNTYNVLHQVDPSARSLESRYVANGTTHKGLVNVDKVHIVPVEESLLGELSAQVHRQLHHCAGYNTYDSLDAARAALQPRQPLAGLTRPDYTITQQALVKPWIAQQTAANITDTIQSLADFNNRYYNGSTGAQASDWLKNTWQTMAAGRSDISVKQVFRGSDRQASVVLTITGTQKPDQIVVMGAHLDTVNWNDAGGQSHETARAPGADDDASGVAGLTETLRVLLANGYKPARTIQLMAYSGEEFGLYGSNYIATDYANRNIDVVGMLQLDMTNYKGSAGDIYLEDDYTDAQQNQFVESLANTYLPQLSVMHDKCGYGCSDHASWHNQGYATSMPFESRLGDDNPYIHSSKDTYANSGNQAQHALKFTRLALAFAVELGGNGNGGDTPPPPGGDDVLANGVPRTGLSGASGSTALFKVVLPAGARNLVIAVSGGSGDVDLYTRYGSAPTTSSYDCRPYRSGNSESCSVPSPQAGTYYVQLRGYQAYSGVTLKATWTSGSEPPPPADDELANGVAKTGLSGSSGGTAVYKVIVPGGAGNLVIASSGGTGDVDLYARFGATPTSSSYDCRPYRSGNNESCTFGQVQAGTYYVMLKGYQAYSGVSLKASWNGG